MDASKKANLIEDIEKWHNYFNELTKLKYIATLLVECFNGLDQIVNEMVFVINDKTVINRVSIAVSTVLKLKEESLYQEFIQLTKENYTYQPHSSFLLFCSLEYKKFQSLFILEKLKEVENIFDEFEEKKLPMSERFLERIQALSEVKASLEKSNK